MLRTVEGTYRNGRVELAEVPAVRDDTPVLVTFLGPGPVDLAALHVDPVLASELRASLSSFAEEWESPEMDVYDDYAAALRHTPRFKPENGR